MKKFYFLIPFSIIPIIISFWFVEAGQNQWTQSLQNASISNDCIVINPLNPQLMYAASTNNGIYRSTDGGSTWLLIPQTLPFTALAISNSSPNIFYAGTATAGMYKSTDACQTWAPINNGITEYTSNVQAIDIKPNDPNTVVICIFNGSSDANPGVYKTTNGGTNWFASSTGMSLKNILSLATCTLQPNTIYAGSSFFTSLGGPVRIYKSYDFGSNWINASNGFDTSSTGTDVVRDLSISTIDTNVILAGRFWNTSNGGPWLTTNAGLTWVLRAGGIPITTEPGPLIRSVKIRPGSNTEFYLGGDFSNSLPPGGVWRTTNAGLNWYDFNSGPMNQNNTVRSLNFKVSGDSTLLAGVSVGTIGIYNYSFVTVSQAFCEGFTSTTFPPAGWSVVYTGTNYWSRRNFSGFGLGQGCADFDNYDAPAGTIQSLVTPVFTPTGTNDSLCYDIAYCSWSSYPDDSLIILTSSNGGATYNSFLRLGELQMGTITNCSHPYTAPSATDWNRRKYHLPQQTNRIAIQAVSGFGDHLYLDSICICNLVGIKNPLIGVPKVYSLSQNYPNPFNPVTTIEYQLPKAGLVKLTLYDILGKEVQVMVNNTQPAGSYKIEWNGENFPSGVYFYKIQAGDFIETKKMVLLK